jgi:hypothetical protein
MVLFFIQEVGVPVHYEMSNALDDFLVGSPLYESIPPLAQEANNENPHC